MKVEDKVWVVTGGGQAFTHLSLIDAAITLDRQLEANRRAPSRRAAVIPSPR